jgi:hypothetical protein
MMTENTTKRIKTNPLPNLAVVEHSTPIVVFGNIEKSKVATLGINPSKNEFLNNENILLSDEKKRFETLKSIGSANLSTLSDIQVKNVYDACLSYFKVNPYRKWFDQLENHILVNFNVSYYSESACHLDVVQWATDPIWRNLDKKVKDELIRNDIWFLETQLCEYDLDVLLINGNSAFEIFKKYFKPRQINQSTLYIKHDNDKEETCRVYEFELNLREKKIKVFAWSKNLQSSIGLTKKMKNKISNWLANNRPQ